MNGPWRRGVTVPHTYPAKRGHWGWVRPLLLPPSADLHLDNVERLSFSLSDAATCISICVCVVDASSIDLSLTLKGKLCWKVCAWVCIGLCVCVCLCLCVYKSVWVCVHVGLCVCAVPIPYLGVYA